jgi:hypothetical protein
MGSSRFLKTLALLAVSLFLLVSGVEATLDHASRVSAQGSFVIYDDQGRALFAYEGDLNDCKVCVKPSASFIVPRFLHRT